MSQTPTIATAPRTLVRVVPVVDAIFFLALGILTVAISVGVILR